MSSLAEARKDFPILEREVQGAPLVYLDNAATSQKPRQVLDASRRYYEEVNSNIHRGVHHLAQLATAAHEGARETVARHLGCEAREVVFTSGTTESINLVSNVLARSGKIGAGDEIVISGLEHHSNIVPWQMLCEQVGSKLRVIPVLDDGTLDLVSYRELLSDRTRLVSFSQVSNAFGTNNPVEEMVAAARAVGALTMVDGAQAIPHQNVAVKGIGCDFYVFSGHKIYAPTGIGVLYGRADLLEDLPPWKGGGEMIKEVTFERTTYNDLPFKYEAGTPNIEGAIGLGAALDYVNNLGLSVIKSHEQRLLSRAAEGLGCLKGVRIYGPEDRSSALSFNFEGVHPYDLGTLLDQMGFALRTGHHCCQPLMARFGIGGTVRASFALYNTDEELDRFLEAVPRALRMLG